MRKHLNFTSLIIFPSLILFLSAYSKNLTNLNMSKILDWLYLGGSKEATDVNWLIDNKISHVLNVATGTQNLQYPGNIDVFRIPIRDNPNEEIRDYLEYGYIYLDVVRLLSGRVLVHCVAGISRSATFVIYYLMKSRSMPLLKAFTIVKKKRDIIHPNPGFLRTLYQKEIDIITSIGNINSL